MTIQTDKAGNSISTWAVIGFCVVAFGVLMGIRGEFEQLWVQTVLACCAGAFLGVALYAAQSYRALRKDSVCHNTGNPDKPPA